MACVLCSILGGCGPASMAVSEVADGQQQGQKEQNCRSEEIAWWWGRHCIHETRGKWLGRGSSGRGEVFGFDQPVILHLIEVEPGMKALEGVVMEIKDSAFPLVREIIATSDLKQGFGQVDYTFLVGAKPRGPGMERKDLLKDNANIFAIQGKAMNEVAKPTCLTLVVGNPANTNEVI